MSKKKTPEPPTSRSGWTPETAARIAEIVKDPDARRVVAALDAERRALAEQVVALKAAEREARERWLTSPFVHARQDFLVSLLAIAVDFLLMVATYLGLYGVHQVAALLPIGDEPAALLLNLDGYGASAMYMTLLGFTLWDLFDVRVRRKMALAVRRKNQRR